MKKTVRPQICAGCRHQQAVGLGWEDQCIDFEIQSSGWAWPLAVGARPLSFSSNSGFECSSLTTTVSCSWLSCSHCGNVTLGAWSEAVLWWLCFQFSHSFAGVVSKQALFPSISLGQESLSSCCSLKESLGSRLPCSPCSSFNHFVSPWSLWSPQFWLCRFGLPFLAARSQGESAHCLVPFLHCVLPLQFLCGF